MSSPAELSSAYFSRLRSETYQEVTRLISSLNISALESRATREMSKLCTGSYCIAHGGFNIVFILTFSDGSDVIARLAASPANQRTDPDDIQKLTFTSEVATLRFLKTRTAIPVPVVHYAEYDGNNPVGVRFMLMERIVGVTLALKKLSIDGQENIVTQLAHIEGALLSLKFPKIGMIEDAEGSIGPLGHYSARVNPLRENRGPFRSSGDYIKAHIQAELDLIADQERWTEERQMFANVNGGLEDFPHATAAIWFEHLQAGISKIPPVESECPFVLYHDDFNDGNILVSATEPVQVVGIIDWEGALVGPLWDGKRLCRSVDECVELDHFDRLEAIRWEIIRQYETRVWQSDWDLGRLFDLVAALRSVYSKRSRIDKAFMLWFEAMKELRSESDEVLKAFMPLVNFING